MRVQVADRLKHGSKGVARPIRQPLRRAIVIAEVALTVIIATGAGLFLQSFNRLLHVDPGFVRRRRDGRRHRAAAVALRRRAEPARVRRRGRVADRRAAIRHGGRRRRTSCRRAAAARGIGVAVEGRPAPAPGDELSAGYRVVTPDYFKTLGIPIVAGRGFTAQDARIAVPLIRWFPQQPLPPGFNDPQAAPAAVINQSMARQFWPGAGSDRPPVHGPLQPADHGRGHRQGQPQPRARRRSRTRVLPESRAGAAGKDDAAGPVAAPDAGCRPRCARRSGRSIATCRRPTSARSRTSSTRTSRSTARSRR